MGVVRVQIMLLSIENTTKYTNSEWGNTTEAHAYRGYIQNVSSGRARASKLQTRLWK